MHFCGRRDWKGLADNQTLSQFLKYIAIRHNTVQLSLQYCLNRMSIVVFTCEWFNKFLAEYLDYVYVIQTAYTVYVFQADNVDIVSSIILSLHTGL